MKKSTLQQILPLGTIVSLIGGTKKVMIIGRLQEETVSGKQYDYASCLYPEGVLDPHELFLFQQHDIDKVYFVGMQDQEEFAFRTFMEEKLKELNLLQDE